MLCRGGHGGSAGAGDDPLANPYGYDCIVPSDKPNDNWFVAQGAGGDSASGQDACFSFGEVASGASASYAAQCGSAEALSAVTRVHWQTAPCGCARVDASVVAVAGATLCARRFSKASNDVAHHDWPS